MVQSPMTDSISLDPRVITTMSRYLIHIELDWISLFIIINRWVILALIVILYPTSLVLSSMTDSVSLVIRKFMAMRRSLIHIDLDLDLDLGLH